MERVFGTKGNKSKNKTTTAKKPRKKDKTKDDGGTTTEESRDTKKRTGRGTNRTPRETKGSKEMQSATQNNDSGKKQKKSKNKKGKKDASVDTTENPIAKLNEMFKNLAGGKSNPTPSEPSKPAAAAKVKNATICDDEPATSKLPPSPPCIVMPPDVKPAPPPPAPVVKPAAPPVLVVSPAPVTTDPLTPYSPATLNSTLSFTEKWMGEETAKIWLEKVDFLKTKQEFEQIQNVVVPVDACKKWKANRALNQPPQDDFPVLDANLVVFENTYVNMSAIDVALPKSKIFMCQIPLKGSEEAFWKTAFDRQISYMEIITDQEPIEFFPIGNGEHVYHGTMFVNNRRVEAVSEDVTRFAIEVLPEGCSNSIICTITIVKNWSPDSVHAKQAVVIKEIIEMTTFLTKTKDENALVMSKHGAGRAGYFVALAVVVHKLDKATEPPIQEIVKSLRGQRPRAVESLTQYVSLYTTLFYYTKRKVGRSDGDKKAAMECDEPTCKKTVQLTTTFTNALIAEINAAAGRSTLTVTIK
ncbi:Protein CBG21032 [Caenorhabditis briggsae]|uniref:Protein CBG21032 n=1 Tax=Caenorhabditis briggsae TaxID=6238 RepID=A8XZ78_CAEBR|nr:Protein CBG21032 [Caenorhabditis briggsae]CAP37945.2 Protein CBG21032 [Caenorhabditis briggsae]